MKIPIVGVLLILCSVGLAKKPTIYRCHQPDGTVVIQDRRCQVTRLSAAKPKSSVPKQSEKSLPRPEIKGVAKKRQSPQKNNRKADSKRSPYFTFGWDRFIPANWQFQQIKTQQYDQLLLSQVQFKGINDFEQGVKLSVYANTMQQFRHGAFAQALQLYHQIRDNNDHTLLDSQFKSHASYKVFNIKYQLGNKDLALTEFYIDEKHNDLFVVTVVAKEASWLTQWQFAERIIKQL